MTKQKAHHFTTVIGLPGDLIDELNHHPFMAKTVGFSTRASLPQGMEVLIRYLLQVRNNNAENSTLLEDSPYFPHETGNLVWRKMLQHMRGIGNIDGLVIKWKPPI